MVPIEDTTSHISPACCSSIASSSNAMQSKEVAFIQLAAHTSHSPTCNPPIDSQPFQSGRRQNTNDRYNRFTALCIAVMQQSVHTFFIAGQFFEPVIDDGMPTSGCCQRESKRHSFPAIAGRSSVAGQTASVRGVFCPVAA